MPDLVTGIPVYDDLELFYTDYSRYLDDDGRVVNGIENLVMLMLNNRGLGGLDKSVAWAAGMGHARVLGKLLDFGFPLTTKAVHWARLNGQLDCIQVEINGRGLSLLDGPLD